LAVTFDEQNESIPDD
jgi:hypothetical protein